MSGYWSIVVPEATTNLITNPSLELAATTGFTKVGASTSLAASTAYAKYGAYSLSVTPDTGTTDGVYYSVSLTDTVAYAFTVWIRGVNAIPYKVYFANDSGTKVGTETTFTGSAAWVRIAVYYTAAATATHRLYIAKNDSADVAAFYVDALQLEAKSSYYTDYCDGDQKGCEWTGALHASTSTRTVAVTTTGREYDLQTQYSVRVLDNDGAGMPPITHNITDRAVIPGAEFQSYKVNARPLLITLAAPITSMAAYHSKRKDMIELFRLDSYSPTQPVTLRYTGSGGNTMECYAYYEGGLEWEGVNTYRMLTLGLRFICYDPFFYEIGEDHAALSYAQTLSNANPASYIDGVFAGMGTHADDTINCMAVGPDKKVYAGGAFHTIGGTTVNHVAVWTGSAWAALGSGTDGVDDEVLCMCVTPGNVLWVGGKFHNAGGSAAYHIAYFDQTDWHTPAADGFDDEVYTMAWGVDYLGAEAVYVGGAFHHENGGTSIDYNHIAKCTSAAVAVMANGAYKGLTDVVRAICMGDQHRIYIGGDFHDLTGTPALINQHICYWGYDPTTGVDKFVAITGTGDPVYSLAYGDKLYVGGTFTDVGKYIAAWNGSAYEELNSGLDENVVYDMAYGNGNLYVVGPDAEYGSSRNASLYAIAKWNGSAWGMLGGGLGSSDGRSIAVDGDNVYYGGVHVASGDTAVQNTVTNSGTAIAYPKIIIKGVTAKSELYFLRNDTTGKVVYLSYSIQAGETVTLDCAPGSRSIISSWLGKVWYGIMRGSELSEFYLAPGANKISVYISAGSGAPVANMTWKNTHWGIDGSAA